MTNGNVRYQSHASFQRHCSIVSVAGRVKCWMTNTSKAPQRQRRPELALPHLSLNALPRIWPLRKIIPAPDVTSRSHIISMSCPLIISFLTLPCHVFIGTCVPPFVVSDSCTSFSLIFHSTCVVFPFTPFVTFLLFFASHRFLSFVLVPRALLFISLTFDCQTRTRWKRPNLTLFWCEEKIAYSVTHFLLSALLF